MYKNFRPSIYGSQAKKRFGQHFLVDPYIIEQIIDCINPKPLEQLIEIGPGQGALTKPILRLIHKLTAIEVDQDLANHLRGDCQSIGDLRLYQGDVLDFDFHAHALANQKWRVFGNLPYNISTPLIFHLIKQISSIQTMHFMLQHEVAARLSAQPGNRTYGRLSVMVQYYCEVSVLFEVDATAFQPRPKVQSSFVQLIPHKKRTLYAQSDRVFYVVVKEAFSKRRKTLQNALKLLLNSEQLQSLGIDPLQRAETLSVIDFVALSNFISNLDNV